VFTSDLHGLPQSHLSFNSCDGVRLSWQLARNYRREKRGIWWNDNWRGKPLLLRKEKLATMPLGSPQIPHELPWDLI
jgi:hypothetical protein